jgi:hypothetical protein
MLQMPLGSKVHLGDPRVRLVERFRLLSVLVVVCIQLSSQSLLNLSWLYADGYSKPNFAARIFLPYWVSVSANATQPGEGAG